MCLIKLDEPSIRVLLDQFAELLDLNLTIRESEPAGEMMTLDASFCDHSNNIVAMGVFIREDPRPPIYIDWNPGYDSSGNDQVLLDLVQELVAWKSRGLATKNDSPE